MSPPVDEHSHLSYSPQDNAVLSNLTLRETRRMERRNKPMTTSAPPSKTRTLHYTHSHTLYTHSCTFLLEAWSSVLYTIPSSHNLLLLSFTITFSSPLPPPSPPPLYTSSIMSSSPLPHPGLQSTTMRSK